MTSGFWLLFSVFIYTTNGNRKGRAYFQKISARRLLLFVLHRVYRVLRSMNGQAGVAAYPAKRRKMVDLWLSNNEAFTFQSFMSIISERKLRMTNRDFYEKDAFDFSYIVRFPMRLLSR